jgi:inner membrane protein
MLLFGHIGFTLAAALLLNDFLPKNRFISPQEVVEKADSSSKVPVLKGPSAKLWTLVKRTKGLDLRFVIIGSLLPDIIDKPIGNYFFRNIFGNGVLYCHTLLFILILTLVGYFTSVIYKKSFIFLLAFGSFVHLILDFVWLNPSVFLWPLFGFTFEKGTSPPFREWLWGLLLEVFKMPWVAIPELVGVIITIWFVWLLWRQKKLRTFIIKGQV